MLLFQLLGLFFLAQHVVDCCMRRHLCFKENVICIGIDGSCSEKNGCDFPSLESGLSHVSGVVGAVGEQIVYLVGYADGGRTRYNLDMPISVRINGEEGNYVVISPYPGNHVVIHRRFANQHDTMFDFTGSSWLKITGGAGTLEFVVSSLEDEGTAHCGDCSVLKFLNHEGNLILENFRIDLFEKGLFYGIRIAFAINDNNDNYCQIRGVRMHEKYTHIDLYYQGAGFRYAIHFTDMSDYVDGVTTPNNSPIGEYRKLWISNCYFGSAGLFIQTRGFTTIESNVFQKGGGYKSDDYGLQAAVTIRDLWSPMRIQNNLFLHGEGLYPTGCLYSHLVHLEGSINVDPFTPPSWGLQPLSIHNNLVKEGDCEFEVIFTECTNFEVCNIKIDVFNNVFLAYMHSYFFDNDNIGEVSSVRWFGQHGSNYGSGWQDALSCNTQLVNDCNSLDHEEEFTSNERVYTHQFYGWSNTAVEPYPFHKLLLTDMGEFGPYELVRTGNASHCPETEFFFRNRSSASYEQKCMAGPFVNEFKDCGANCIECIDAHTCTKCHDSHFLLPSGECTTFCPEYGLFRNNPSNRQCEECPLENCTCFASSTDCFQCKKGLAFSEFHSQCMPVPRSLCFEANTLCVDLTEAGECGIEDGCRFSTIKQALSHVYSYGGIQTLFLVGALDGSPTYHSEKIEEVPNSEMGGNTDQWFVISPYPGSDVVLTCEDGNYYNFVGEFLKISSGAGTLTFYQSNPPANGKVLSLKSQNNGPVHIIGVRFIVDSIENGGIDLFLSGRPGRDDFYLVVERCLFTSVNGGERSTALVVHEQFAHDYDAYTISTEGVDNSPLGPRKTLWIKRCEFEGSTENAIEVLGPFYGTIEANLFFQAYSNPMIYLKKEPPISVQNNIFQYLGNFTSDPVLSFIEILWVNNDPPRYYRGQWPDGSENLFVYNNIFYFPPGSRTAAGIVTVDCQSPAEFPSLNRCNSVEIKIHFNVIHSFNCSSILILAPADHDSAVHSSSIVKNYRLNAYDYCEAFKCEHLGWGECISATVTGNVDRAYPDTTLASGDVYSMDCFQRLGDFPFPYLRTNGGTTLSSGSSEVSGFDYLGRVRRWGQVGAFDDGQAVCADTECKTCYDSTYPKEPHLYGGIFYSEECTECFPPFVLYEVRDDEYPNKHYESRCVLWCPDVGPYYNGEDSSSCVRCPTNLNCLRCVSPEICILCEDGYYLNIKDGQCYSNEECTNTGNFISEDSYPPACVGCNPMPVNCLICEGAGICVECQETSFLDEKQQCVPCSSVISGCDTCESDDVCESCLDGWFVHEGECVTDCGEEVEPYYSLAGYLGSCVPCESVMSACEKCITHDKCIECSSNRYYIPDFYLNCVQDCNIDTGDQFTLAENGIMCVECSEVIDDCHQCTSRHDCYSCRYPSWMSPVDGTCVEYCNEVEPHNSLIGKIDEMGRRKCVPCSEIHRSCLDCYSAEWCNECMDIEGTVLWVQPWEQYCIRNNDCHVPNCDWCYPNGTCAICSEGLYSYAFNGTCVTSCENNIGGYNMTDSPTLRCANCMENCMSCEDDLLCNECFPPFFLYEDVEYGYHICTTDCSQFGAQWYNDDGGDGLRRECKLCVMCDTCELDTGKCTSCYLTNHTGDLCEEADCSMYSNCSSHGDCIFTDEIKITTHCDCFPDYFGAECNIFECETECMNGGTCIGSDLCNCLDGYNGSVCEFPICPDGCFGKSLCVAPGECECEPKKYSGKRCEIPVCWDVPANVSLSCNGETCKSPNNCVCKRFGKFGQRCENDIFDFKSLSNAAKSIIGSIGGVISAIIVIVGVVAFVLFIVLLVHRWRKLKRIRVIIGGFNVEEGEQLLSEGECKKGSEEIAAKCQELMKYIGLADDRNIARLCDDIVLLVVSLKQNILNPRVVATNLIESIKHPNFEHLSVGAKKSIVMTFERFLAVLITFFENDEEASIDDHHSDLTLRCNALISNVNKKLFEKSNCLEDMFELHELKVEIVCVLEALKVVKKSEHGALQVFKKVMTKLANVKNVTSMFKTVINEYKSISKEWWGVSTVSRMLSYQLMTCEVLDEKMLQNFWETLGSFKDQPKEYAYSSMLTLASAIRHCKSDQVKQRLFDGMEKLKNGLRDLLALEDDKISISTRIMTHVNTGMQYIRKGHVRSAVREIRSVDEDRFRICNLSSLTIRGSCLKVLGSFIENDEDFSEDFRSACKIELVHRGVLETNDKILAMVQDLQSSLLREGEFETLVKRSGKDIVKKVDDAFTHLDIDKMTLENKKQEVSMNIEKCSMIKEEVERLEKRQEDEKSSFYKIHGATHDEKMKELEEKINSNKKQLEYLKELKVEKKLAKKKDLQKMTDFRNNIETLQDELDIVGTSHKKLLRIQNEIASNGEKLEELETSINEDQMKMAVDELRIKNEESKYQKRKERLKQIEQDYKVALLLQEEFIRDKVSKPSDRSDVDDERRHDLVQRTMDLFSDEESYDEDPPQEYKCPITLNLMECPCCLVDSGLTYEKHALEEWLSDNNTDPVTNKILKSKMFVEVITLRTAIQDWKEKHKIVEK